MLNKNSTITEEERSLPCEWKILFKEQIFPVLGVKKGFVYSVTALFNEGSYLGFISIQH